MAELVKSILFVDLDGLGRDLAAPGGAAMDERLAERIDDWSGAIENGELIEPEGTPHAIAERRCYAGSSASDAARAAFADAGFEMVDCGKAEPALCLAVDAMDAAAEAEAETIFILLTAAPDLTLLVERLRARGHRVAIYAGEETAADYRTAADMVIPASALAAILADGETRPKAPAPAPSADRARVEAFAREIHEATSIPMLSPKTFTELFRTLAAEVTQRGYHFHDTAKSVADQLAAAGRTVTARQVVFVVKGLALKGHVFSTGDSAERLADVFREQARYLIDSAGVALDKEREALLTAWIAAPGSAPAKPERAAPPKADSKPARQAQPAAADDDGKPAAKPAPARPDKPTARPAPRRVPERPKSAALSARAAAQEPPKPAKSDDLKTTIAARIAASAKLKPSARPPAKSESPPPPPPEPAAPEEAEDAIESSILAAIAEAVDVLVEDGGSDTAETPPAPPKPEAGEPAGQRAASGRPPAEDAPPAADEEPDEQSGDIGDEIQRIVASYNRNRDSERRG